MQDGGRVLVKRCARCLEQLPLDKFYRRSRASDRLSSYCNACVIELGTSRRYALRKVHDARCLEDVHKALVNDAPINFAGLTRKTRRDLLDAIDVPGARAADVATRVGCSTVTVHKHRRERMIRDAKQDQDA